MLLRPYDEIGAVGLEIMDYPLSHALTFGARYGGYVWPAAWLLCVGVAALLTRVWLRSAMGRRAQVARARLGDVAEAPACADEAVTVSGVLAADDIAVGTVFAAARDERFDNRAWLETQSGMTIAIDTDIDVCLGSTEDWRFGRRGATVRVGDRVLARGVLTETVADAGPATFRTRATSFRLAPGAAPVEVAFAEQPRVRAPRRMVVPILLAAVAAGAVMVAGGALMQQRCARGEPASCEIAMYTPYRGDALRSCADQAHAQISPSYSDLVRGAALELLVDGRCTRTLEKARRVRGGAWLGDLGVACGTPGAVHIASAWHFDRGEFARAAELMHSIPPLDGAWHRSSRVAVLSAVGDYIAIADEIEGQLPCVARGFRMLAKEESEPPTCDSDIRADLPRDETCAIVDAAFCGPEFRRKAFCVDAGWVNRRCQPLVEPLAGTGGGMSLTRGAFRPPDNVALTLWLAKELHESPRPDRFRSIRVPWAMEAAALESFMGAHEEAITWLDRAHGEIAATDLKPEYDHWWDTRAAVMRAEVEFRRGGRNEARLALMGLAQSEARDVAVAAMIMADAHEQEDVTTMPELAVADATADDYDLALATCADRESCDSAAIAVRATTLAISARQADLPDVAKRLDHIAAEHRANVRNYTAQVLASLVR